MTDTVKSVIGWIEEAARQLQRNLRDGYTRSFEYELASQIVARLVTDEARKEILRHFVFEHLETWPLMGLALDECAAKSYAVLGECADKITDLAWQQMVAERSDLVLRRMITEAICDEQRSIPALTA